MRKQERKRKYSSPVKQKLLLLLASGLALLLTRSPRKYFLILKNIPRELRELDRHNLYRAIREFEKDRLVSYRELRDGTVTLIISEEGRQRALSYQVDSLCITTPKKWDGVWRLVLFDIPERKRIARDALRNKLKELGFRELQRSVHIFPYPCKDEIDFLIEFFDSRSWVYYVETDTISNEARLITRFKLHT